MNDDIDGLVDDYCSGVVSMLGNFNRDAVEEALGMPLLVVVRENVLSTASFVEQAKDAESRRVRVTTLDFLCGFLKEKYSLSGGYHVFLPYFKEVVATDDELCSLVDKVFRNGSLVMFPFSMITIDDLFEFVEYMASAVSRSSLEQHERNIVELVRLNHASGVVPKDAADLFLELLPD